jgi:homoserine kinase
VLTDLIAEPYRKSLLPGYEAATNYLKQQGCLAVGISGSGPTLFCVTDDAVKAELYAKWLEINYLQTSISGKQEGFVHVCRVDNQGAVSLP